MNSVKQIESELQTARELTARLERELNEAKEKLAEANAKELASLGAGDFVTVTDDRVSAFTKDKVYELTEKIGYWARVVKDDRGDRNGIRENLVRKSTKEEITDHLLAWATSLGFKVGVKVKGKQFHPMTGGVNKVIVIHSAADCTTESTIQYWRENNYKPFVAVRYRDGCALSPMDNLELIVEPEPPMTAYGRCSYRRSQESVSCGCYTFNVVKLQSLLKAASVGGGSTVTSLTFGQDCTLSIVKIEEILKYVEFVNSL